MKLVTFVKAGEERLGLFDRDAWRVVEPHTVTGRRIAPDPDRWPFDPAAYL